jgi:hypothetical protein
MTAPSPRPLEGLTILVVDCDETNIAAYNARTLAVYRTTMLPERMTLVQATTDTGAEYVANAVIK